jgi:predicted ester cyclase
MTDEIVAQNVALTRRWFEEVWSRKRTQTIHELLSPDCVTRGTGERGEGLCGPQGFVDFHARLIRAFPDLHIEVLDCFGAGDKVAARWFATMHHHGEGLGMAPTGAEVKFAGTSIAHFVDGKVVETWDNYDKFGMFQQIEAAANARRASA